MKKALKKILEWFAFLVGGYGTIAEQAKSEKLVDYSGQGKEAGK